MEGNNLIHNFKQAVTPSESMLRSLFTPSTIVIYLIALVIGIGTGLVLSSIKKPTPGVKTGVGITSAKRGEVIGLSDEKTFRDQTEGKLISGGIDGEGAYHLERPGGVSQNVYLTSSVIDLGRFVTRKVRVWGETNKAKKAGWLMDVGRLQILE